MTRLGTPKHWSAWSVNELVSLRTCCPRQGNQLCQSLPPSLHLGEILDLRETLRSWCERTFRDFLDTCDVLADRPALFSDGLHPTSEGHRLLAEAVGNV